jgi:hypothetical protein
MVINQLVNGASQMGRLVTRVEHCLRMRCDECSAGSEADVSYHIYRHLTLHNHVTKVQI